MNNTSNDSYKVGKITTLKKIRQEEAKQILQKVSKLVQPIMSKHQWRVDLLAEYCPKNPFILGENVGGGEETLEVKLRLRRSNSEIDFFPFDQIFDNMLHQLCHNKHGPHDDKFYNLLDQVRKECKELMIKEELDLHGRVNNSRKHTFFSFIPSGPKNVGGNSTLMKSLRPREAATMAAERRLRIDIWCGTISVSDSVQSPSYDFKFLVDGSKSILKVLVWVVLFEAIWLSSKYLFW